MTTQRPRSMVPDTPPNSVAVGISDGPILLARVYDRLPNSSFMNAMNVGLPQNHSFGAQGDIMTENPDDLLSPSNVGRRHPTWSHDLSLQERPRSRSLSISRSTQTNVDSKKLATPNGARHIIFNTDENGELANCSTLARKDCKEVGCNAINTFTGISNIKVSITDDEFDDVDQIIAQVMEEEEEEEEETEEHMQLNQENRSKGGSRTIHPEISLNKPDEDSDISNSCEVVSKSF